jgi:hypothetical protein
MPVRIAAATLLAAAAAGCLPRGAPPSGQQILHDRSTLLAGLVPPNGDGLLRLLVTRPGSTSARANLSVLSLDADNNLLSEVLLVPDIDPVFTVNCSGGLAPCMFDSQGTILVGSSADKQLRVNPITGDVQPVSPFDPEPPPLGQRGYIYQSMTSGTLYDADGHTTEIQLAPPPPNGFGALYKQLGDDFYYVDPQHNLIEFPPTDVPQQVAAGVINFKFWDTDDGPVLGLSRTKADGSGTLFSIGDPRSGMETILPFDVMTAALSPDARWVLDTTNEMAGQFSFFDRSSGTPQSVDIGQPARFADWRPGTSEAWVMGAPPDWHQAGTVWILRPDAPPISVPDINVAGGTADGGGSIFTADGVYWFASTATTDSGTNVYQIGRADAPTGPRYSLNPPATFLGLFDYLPNDRFLSADYVKDYNRSDLRLLDPRTGEQRLLAERGRVAGLGDTRFMGIFHVDESRGDLVVGGFEDQPPTKLASEFTSGAFAEPQGADQLAPGSRIVYQFQARTASPYDGIWVVTCP